MKITKIIIKNFQSFGPEGIETSLDNSTVLIGANNSGKTAMLLALQKIFGITQSLRQIHKADFHIPRGKNFEDFDELRLSIEVFIEFPEIDLEESQKKAKAAYFNQLIIRDDNSPPYFRIRLEAVWERNMNIEGNITQIYRYIKTPEMEQQSETTNWVKMKELGIIQMIYVPALRSPSNQIKNSTGTIIWRLFRYLKWSESLKKSIIDEMKVLNGKIVENQGIGKIEEIINQEWKKYNDIKYFSNTNFSFATGKLDDILKKIEISFKPSPDEINYDIEQISDGMKSLFYISLVCSLLEIESKILNEAEDLFSDTNYTPPYLTIVAIEEPENHLAPHLLGKTIQNLQETSKLEIAQILITSHSPSILKRINPETIRHFRLDLTTNTTSIRKILLPSESDEAFKFVKQGVQFFPEMYFSKLIILVEGDSEKIVFPRLFQVEDILIDNHYISIIPLGGKFVNYFWKLLNDLMIPHITLLDFDIYKKIQNPLKYICKELLEINPNFQIGEYDINLSNIDQIIDSIDITDDIFRNQLERKNIFFSYPLDFDFLMIESFLEQYKLLKGRGPNVLRHIEEPDYEDQLEHYVKTPFKDDFILNESVFSEKGELLAWHKYLFNNNKPLIHYLFLSEISNEQLNQNISPILKEIIQKSKNLLEE
ncbi:ATP-dependent endonuclease [Promethearchaeum syntrophicum]|uniref:ATP-dependent endonuclease n=1 Tax=Promethearchaeum syntrophicum TaxID=2594042 RepID=A0A5B9D6C1_9ARCH|nr:AAA family ATPase [Candidatus Prometheoarchaeum syntrophicum]QEE14491.1 hypothetical protein DSAG12_00304 [Candidatus Prometheoarchaeum syntrophicum]